MILVRAKAAKNTKNAVCRHNMTWHQLSVTTDEQTAPQLADFFTELGAVSVTYLDAEDQPIYEPALNETKIWANTTVVALYELTSEPQRIKDAVFAHFAHNPLKHWQAEILADQDWERAWMAHYQPMKFGDKLWVCPTGQEQQQADTVCMTLDPGLAFGTGTHPTTALCLEWLASHELTDKIIIDYGCGSGILAVAAVLLGAKQAYAIDIDPQAITATLANAEKNQVVDKISCYLPEQFPVLQADVVLANILAKPLIKLAATISQLVKPHGQLVLSGILTEQAQTVATAYEAEITIDAVVSQQDWCRIDGTKSL
jgi:ribosomal protein L11 methyltransferase